MWQKSLAKVKQLKVARVELRDGGGLHGPEKASRSVGCKEKKPGNKKTSSEDNNNISATNITKNSWRFSHAKHVTVEFA